MSTAMCESMMTPMTKAIEATEVSDQLEGQLVRGSDQSLLQRLEPLVRQHNVELDVASVERIDAAGITALLALYKSARDSGHRFSLRNVSDRVAQILTMVWLERILLSHNAVRSLHCGPRTQRPAA